MNDLHTITEFLSEQNGGGTFSISYNPDRNYNGQWGRWVCASTYGKEAEDSDMAGAQAIGVGNTVTEAVNQMYDKIGIEHG